jgi:putative membrane protein
MSRHRRSILAAALLLAFVSACRNPGEKVNSGAAGSSGTDTSGTTAITTGSTGGTVSNLSAEDKTFVMKAAEGGMAEVRLGRTAQSKSQNADVQAFAKRMVDDHSKANDELKQLATTKGLALPTDLDTEHKKVVGEISGKSGKNFDRSYMNEMVGDHDRTLKALQDASTNAKDADIKNWASKTLPIVQEHLRMAKETQKKVK